MTKCSVKYCSRESETKGMCKKHYLADYRAKNKMKYAFQNLKDNAKRRGKVFELTFEQFEKFAVRVDYIKKKGRKSDSIHIDRIIEEGGYTEENIQPLENGANVRKFLDYHYGTDRMHFNTRTIKPNKENGTPF